MSDPLSFRECCYLFDTCQLIEMYPEDNAITVSVDIADPGLIVQVPSDYRPVEDTASIVSAMLEGTTRNMNPTPDVDYTVDHSYREELHGRIIEKGIHDIVHIVYYLSDEVPNE